MPDALAPYTKTLVRPIYTYHCAPRSRLALPPAGYLAPDDPRVTPFLIAKIARLWDLTIPHRPYAQVSGLYAGVDPVVCFNFGGVGGRWALIQIRLEKGFRFLDVRGSPARGRGEVRFTEPIRRRLRTLGCEASFPSTLLSTLESQPCREVAVAALGELAVDGILLSYPAANLEGCENPLDGAFILLRNDLVQRGRTKLLTQEWRAADAAGEDRKRIRDLVVRARHLGSVREIPWPTLPGTLEPSAMEVWMGEHIFGCGKYTEDQQFTEDQLVEIDRDGEGVEMSSRGGKGK